MREQSRAVITSLITILLLAVIAPPADAQVERPDWMDRSIALLESELVQAYGENVHERLHRGLDQVSTFWRPEDGNQKAFEEFVRVNFAGDQKTLDTMFNRFEHLLEELDGHMLEISLEFRRQTDLDLGPILPFDEAFAGYDPSAHITDDFFGNKLAFTVLLNFPLTTLEQRLEDGRKWNRRQWAEVRLAQRFSKRIPSKVNLAVAEAGAAADTYISGYNIWMHHLIDQSGTRFFPAGLRLLSHWNLRDEIKAQYSYPDSGLIRQRMIQKVMERIVTQTIPAVVIDNPHVDWDPYTNEVKASAVNDADDQSPSGMEITNEPEADTRYAVLLSTFLAAKKIDPYSPTAPTLIARRFEENREIPENRVRSMFGQILTSPLVGRIARLIESRLGRPLEPFDIWYNGFKPAGPSTEAELDEIVRNRYPTPQSFEKDIPELLVKLGFDRDRAEYLAGHIVVDPARGSGHAWGAAMRSAKAHLRTRVGPNGMDYKGFNIAVHEMGHNVEQVFSLNDIDHTLLAGVPNTAFTEALAFVFQARDLELLGLQEPDVRSEAMETINDFWMTYEISGVALVDMDVWHWMYAHPNATPAELKKASIDISKNVWNRYFAPVFHRKDVVLLGIYSHMIDSFLYIPDYPLGHLIAFQIKEQMKKAGDIGAEFERMATLGRIAPDIWMTDATGHAVGTDALLEASEAAMKELEARNERSNDTTRLCTIDRAHRRPEEGGHAH